MATKCQIRTARIEPIYPLVFFDALWVKIRDEGLARNKAVYVALGVTPEGTKDTWIPERSATRLREADLNILSKLGKQGLEWRLEPEAFTGREVGREDDLLDFPVGCPVDIEVARQPST